VSNEKVKARDPICSYGPQEVAIPTVSTGTFKDTKADDLKGFWQDPICRGFCSGRVMGKS